MRKGQRFVAAPRKQLLEVVRWERARQARLAESYREGAARIGLILAVAQARGLGEQECEEFGDMMLTEHGLRTVYDDRHIT